MEGAILLIYIDYTVVSELFGYQISVVLKITSISCGREMLKWRPEVFRGLMFVMNFVLYVPYQS